MSSDRSKRVRMWLACGLVLAIASGPAWHLHADELSVPSRPWQVRLVWLVDGLADEAAKVPPSDLESATLELAKLGLTNLTMAAQILVQVAGEDPFQAGGTANVNEPHSLELSGALLGTQSDESSEGEPDCALRLRMEITARETGEQFVASACHVRTAVVAPVGRAVVLAIVPVQSKPSAFLLLVTPGGAMGIEHGPDERE